MLDTTPTSVNSALIRARATIEERGPHAHDRAPLPRSAQEHELVARFADAFERGDVEPIVALLAEDAWWTMPPEPYGYQGHDAIQAVHRPCVRDAGEPPPPHSDASQLPTCVRPVRQRPTHRRRPRALAARADTRRRPHLAHHPLRRDQRPTALRTPPNDSVVATRSARELSALPWLTRNQEGRVPLLATSTSLPAVDLLVLAPDDAEARIFEGAGTGQPQNGLVARPASRSEQGRRGLRSAATKNLLLARSETGSRDRVDWVSAAVRSPDRPAKDRNEPQSVCDTPREPHPHARRCPRSTTTSCGSTRFAAA